jgi:hypothetical protein
VNLAASAAEIERLKRSVSSAGDLRLSLTRKDEIIAGLRAQAEKAQVEIQQLKFSDSNQQGEGQKKLRSAPA